MNAKRSQQKSRPCRTAHLDDSNDTSDAVASRLQVSDLYKSDLQVSSQFANDLMWKIKVFANKQAEVMIFGLENFTSVENRGET